MKKNDNENFFILFANCIPVKGIARSLICNLQRGKYYYIPNDLFDLLTTVKHTKLIDLYNSFEESNRETLDEYFDFLLKNDLGFIDNEPEVFPEMSLDWDYPSTITNCVIDIDEECFSTINYKDAFAELSNMNCYCIEIRSFNLIDINKLNLLLNYTIDSRIKEVRLVLEYNV